MVCATRTRFNLDEESIGRRKTSYTCIAFLLPYFVDIDIINFKDLDIINFADSQVIKIGLDFCKKSVAHKIRLGKTVNAEHWSGPWALPYENGCGAEAGGQDRKNDGERPGV
jgi:hypothetical protein